MAEYCAKELKYKRIITIADDIAYGHEMCAGFQRVFEENGGKIVQKLFPPLTAPDYGAYVARLKTDADAHLPRHSPARTASVSCVNSSNTASRTRLQRGRRHDRAGRIRAAQHGRRGARHHDRVLVLRRARQSEINKAVCAGFPQGVQLRSRLLRRRHLCRGAVLEAALKARQRQNRGQECVHGGAARHQSRHRARAGEFDEFGNVVGNVYIRKVTRKDGRLVNSVIKTYPDVSQFWTYDPKRVPRQSGLFAGLSAGEELREV